MLTDGYRYGQVTVLAEVTHCCNDSWVQVGDRSQVSALLVTFMSTAMTYSPLSSGLAALALPDLPLLEGSSCSVHARQGQGGRKDSLTFVWQSVGY